MGKALLLSLLVASVALPAVMARDPNPVRGVRRLLLALLFFNLLYVALCLTVYAPNNVPWSL